MSDRELLEAIDKRFFSKDKLENLAVTGDYSDYYYSIGYYISKHLHGAPTVDPVWVAPMKESDNANH